jgi:assimilatory nitrate reductase catalytic subunit
MQCGFKLWTEPVTNRVIGLEGDEDFPTTHGLKCIKGSHSHKQIHHPDRLLTPLLREKISDPFRPASWDEALTLAARRLREIQSAHGADAVAAYGSGALTNESVYLLGKWARLALGTANVDYNGRFCMSSAAAAQNRAFGVDRGMPFPVHDIPLAKFILLVGANPADCLPPLAEFFKEAKSRGAVIVVADPRGTDSLRFADRRLALRPGTDLALAQALLHVLLRDGKEDADFIQARTTGFEAVRDSVKDRSPRWAAEVTGLTAEAIELTARQFMAADTALVLTGRGAEQHSKGVDTVTAFINLVLASGKIGRPGCGFGTLTGQGNGQGGREHGQKADQLPGYRKIADPLHRRHMADFWNVDEKDIPGPGLSAYDMMAAMIAGKIRGLFVMGSNPAVSMPRATTAVEALSRLEFLATVDFFPSETVALSHVVFPAVIWAEDSGTTTNLEGRVLLREKAVDPPGEARGDWKILGDMARALGRPEGFQFGTIEDVFEELRRATRGGTADYSGITYDRLRRAKGIPWPCPDEFHPGTPRLFEDARFFHTDGRARFTAVDHRPSAETPDGEYPLFLTTGRLLAHYLTGNQTHRLPDLESLSPEPRAEISSRTAEKIALRDGGRVRLTTRRGSVEVTLRFKEDLRDDTVFLPIHWGGDRCANILTQTALDPISRMPEFKVCAVRAEAIP